MTLRKALILLMAEKALLHSPSSRIELEKKFIKLLCTFFLQKANKERRFNREDLKLKCATPTCQQLDKKGFQKTFDYQQKSDVEIF